MVVEGLGSGVITPGTSAVTVRCWCWYNTGIGIGTGVLVRGGTGTGTGDIRDRETHSPIHPHQTLFLDDQAGETQKQCSAMQCSAAAESSQWGVSIQPSIR